MTGKKLTRKEIYWAYDKWCIGYTLDQIGEALDCDGHSISRAFKRMNLERIRPVLIYDGDKNDNSTDIGTNKRGNV